MRAASIALILCLSGPILVAQLPIASPQTHTSDLGFTYSPPSDWKVVDPEPTLPRVKEQAKQDAASEGEKRGVACAQVGLTARHGDPASVLVIVELPFACFGQTMSAKDLPGFAQGASDGVKQSFDLSDSVFGAYSLGSHGMWIERARGTPKGHSEAPYTLEIACALLKKGAVCWMAMAANEDALKMFEGGAVALEGDSPTALVPVNAFEKKPAL